MVDASPERSSGCGLLNAVFGKRRTTSTGSFISPGRNVGGNVTKSPSNPNSRQRHGGSDEPTFLGANGSEAPPKPMSMRPSPNHRGNPNMYYQKQAPSKVADEMGMALPSSGVTSSAKNPHKQPYVSKGRRVPPEATGISGELESMIADHQKSRGSSTLVRASSGNVMLFGNLGNLRQPGTAKASNLGNVPDSYIGKAATRNEAPMPNGKYTNSVMGNIVKKPAESNRKPSESPPPASFCRALSTRMDPETLKIMGNEDYKNGRFAEALALYDAAISIDPNKASYRSNRSAALTALGRLLEAVFECREAIRIDPHYQRAHNRLATLYLRLGEAEKAMYHYKQSGPEADPEDIAKAKKVQSHLSKCTEARKLWDWNTLIKESRCAISAGADSAPQIFALQAEALLKLRKHQDADEALSEGPNFEVEECTKFLGPIGNAGLLVVRAQVDLAVGRFDDALEAAQRAARLDSSNKEVNHVIKRARAVAGARHKGNELFKAERFSEACVAYGGGLEHDPYNSVLLCNRAACRSKPGRYEKAVEDCTAALNVRPSYSKARLRRADCFAKLGKWEASIQDYEVLAREAPEDEEVSRALLGAKAQLKRQCGEVV
ncbi:inactive TPR repeat-containing thioredoxin TTL3-like [Rhodamnia argentea]|uniref:Inactive TPR repeat-containing thioredoxin TTL3-like n=1 Tax=Rhodamnia argentea TaxID=178133 RepID=A0A8B8PK51_9MYRT|nr:inactive TPR repeat-containing thioredoxin TTL3-like [Rhodamnia argentea]